MSMTVAWTVRHSSPTPIAGRVVARVLLLPQPCRRQTPYIDVSVIRQSWHHWRPFAQTKNNLERVVGAEHEQ